MPTPQEDGSPRRDSAKRPDPFRPTHHFAPRQNWMNDPNGMVHDGERWHLFFQYNPTGTSWGNMSWGHATSPDLVHWDEHPVALWHESSVDGQGQEAIWSGSVVVDHDDTAGFAAPGGGGIPTLVAVYTSAYASGLQAQSLAYSRDRGMTWTKYEGNPVLDRASGAFRDPKVTWWAPADGSPGYWLLTAVEAQARTVVFYRSADLKSWTLLSELGPLPEPVGLWECPDLFALPVDGDASRARHVLIVSANDERTARGCGTWYAVGHFDGRTFRPGEGGFRRLDDGPDCYAAVTWENAPRGRRVLLGWMSNWVYARETPTASWRGAMTLPRELALETRDGQVRLVQRPVRELAAAADLSRWRVVLDVDAGDLGLELLDHQGVAVAIHYEPATRTLTVDRSGSWPIGPEPAGTSALAGALATTLATAVVEPRGGRVTLDVVVDRCSVEVFADDGAVALTSLVFPAGELTLRAVSAQLT